MNEQESNELRCTANEIILSLHKDKRLGQLQLLFMACSLTIKDIDPMLWNKMRKDMNL